MKQDLFTNRIAVNQHLTSRHPHTDSVSISCRFRVLAMFLLCLTIGVGQMWGGTSTLTSAIISSGTTANSYASYSFTADSKTWNAYAIHNYHSNQTNTVYYLQIKKYASSTAYYVQIPTMPGKINSITMTVSSTGQPKTGGSNSATLYFSNSSSTKDTGTGVASGTGSSSVTINCSTANNLTSGYITASGGTRIWDISVTYCTNPTSLTNGTITSSAAHLSWSDADNTGTYEVYCSTSSTAPALNATPTETVNDTYVDFTSLSSSTTYYWWVRAKCSDSNKSQWVAGSSFTTSSAGSTVSLTKAGQTNGTISLITLHLTPKYIIFSYYISISKIICPFGLGASG